jgi:hypothetical protein
MEAKVVRRLFQIRLHFGFFSKLRGVAVHSSRLARRRSGGGFSAFTLVLIVMLAVTSLFLLVLLVLFA